MSNRNNNKRQAQCFLTNQWRGWCSHLEERDSSNGEVDTVLNVRRAATDFLRTLRESVAHPSISNGEVDTVLNVKRAATDFLLSLRESVARPSVIRMVALK